MKRSLLTLFAVLAVACASYIPAAADDSASAGPTPPPKQSCGNAKSKWQRQQCQNYNNSAPGDEYFGKMKMSYLGIDNTFKDMSIESGDNTTNPSIVSKLIFASDALARWSAKYPGDPELARSYYLGVLVYRKVYTQQGQQMAWQYIQYVIHHFPNTFFGKTLKASIKDGFTEHWYAQALPCPANGAEAAPTPEATASPKPGEPGIDLIAPPCIAASPASEPTPAGTTVPGPNPRPSA